MDAIRDDCGQRIEPNSCASAEQFVATYQAAASEFRLDRQEGQTTRLLLVCEAAGMAPQLANAVENYGVPEIDESGTFRGFVGAATDIHDRKCGIFTPDESSAACSL